MSAQVAADLRAAAEVLRRDGWTQQAYHEDGCHCALGAIAIATGFHDMDRGPNRDGEWRELGSMVGGRPGMAAERLGRFVAGAPSSYRVVEWNDKPCRTAAEVIAALEAAADAAEADQ